MTAINDLEIPAITKSRYYQPDLMAPPKSNFGRPITHSTQLRQSAKAPTEEAAMTH
jgi:hypothetical protein